MKKILISMFLIILFIVIITSFTLANSEIVYVTRTGSKFHAYGCDYLSASKDICNC